MARKRVRDPLEGVNLLELTPVRLAEWEEEAGRVVVIRPDPRTRGFRGALDRVLHKLSPRRIRLDEVGSLAWLSLDGQRTVQDIADLMTETFGDKVHPVEERLGQLVWVLRREGLLGYPGWDEGS